MITLTSADDAIAESVKAALPVGSELVNDRRYQWRIRGTAMREILGYLGLLGHRAWEKFVPSCYLWNTPDVRLAVLLGLLDTDGTILAHSHSVSFSTTSEQLAKDVIFLVQSLGGVAPWRMRQTHYMYKGERREGRPSYHVNVCLPNGVAPFRLQRKLEHVRDKGERNRARRFIVSVESAEADGGVCFEVDHPSNLYVVHDFIVTHNTEGGIMALTTHAYEQPQEILPIPCAIVRDTFSNLQRTTLVSLNQPRPGSFAATIRPFLEFKDGGREIHCTPPGRPRGLWTAYLLGVDSAADMNKLTMQLSILWFEEAAPVMESDVASIGIPESTWLVGLTSLRYGDNNRAIITMNYPDEDHWTWVRFHDEGIGKLLRIPRGENKHLPVNYRENMENDLRGRPDLLNRLVYGRPSAVYPGERVITELEYDEATCRSQVPLNPIPGIRVYRMWDGGQNPTCVFGQIVPSGRFHILDTLRGDNTAMKQFIETQVKPTIGLRYMGITDWFDTGDPSLAYPESSDSAVFVAQIINQSLGACFVPGEPDWGPRREMLKEALVRKQILLSVHEKLLHRAFSGGWHYHRNPSGQVLKTKPIKDLHSHPADALCHSLKWLFPGYERKTRSTRVRTDASILSPNYGQTRVRPQENVL